MALKKKAIGLLVKENKLKRLNRSNFEYFEETKNDKGGISLRFPTVKHIYENERDC